MNSLFTLFPSSPKHCTDTDWATDPVSPVDERRTPESETMSAKGKNKVRHASPKPYVQAAALSPVQDQPRAPHVEKLKNSLFSFHSVFA
jgi:hypothetical protein